MSFDRFRQYTQARIGLGSKSPALPSKAWLEFSYHHACAVDAIRVPWDLTKQIHEIDNLGYHSQILKTKASSRDIYLMRPDLGRLLDDDSRGDCQQLSHLTSDNSILVVISNGLSSPAMSRHLTPLLAELLPRFKPVGLKLAYDRVMLVANGRVGLIDEVGQILNPILGMVIIGERPGLSAPDSIAIYLTYRPQRGRTDAQRNCISNIRPPHGQSYEAASAKVIFIIQEAMRRKLTGILLKEETPSSKTRTISP